MLKRYMKRWKTIKNCLWNNNSINGTMGFVEPMTRLTKKKSSLTTIKTNALCTYYIVQKKKWIKKQSKPKTIWFKFRLRVENMTVFFYFFFSRFLSLTFSRLFTIYDAICRFNNGTKCWIHSIKCHFSSPSSSLLFCLHSLVQMPNKQMRLCMCVCWLEMAILSHLTIKWHQPFIYTEINDILEIDSLFLNMLWNSR